VDDIQELLINVDVLISDYSGCIVDFLLTEKLQLFYPFDMEDYRKSRGEYGFEYIEENLPGLIISDNDDFIRKIKQLEVLIEDEVVKTRIKEYKKKFHKYDDGNSCKRILEYLKLV
jgi:CDP-glycerol glycerophosphotransferase (TagB/SpsB family)